MEWYIKLHWKSRMDCTFLNCFSNRIFYIRKSEVHQCLHHRMINHFQYGIVYFGIIKWPNSVKFCILVILAAQMNKKKINYSEFCFKYRKLLRIFSCNLSDISFAEIS
jgi:hypothetical protein